MVAELITDVTSPVIVLNSGRCGSTLLSSLLRLHPDMLSLSEVFSTLGGPRVLAPTSLAGATFWSLISRLDPDLGTLLEAARVDEVLSSPPVRMKQRSPLELVTLPHLGLESLSTLAALQRLVSDAGDAPPAAHLNRLFAWLAHRCGGRSHWVERSGGSLEYGELLEQNWPRARFILLTRDGRETAYSMAGHPMFRVRLARILARDPSVPIQACLRTDIPVHRFGAYWSALMLKARHLLRTKTERDLLHVRYEALVREPRKVLGDLTLFITGREAPSSWLADAGKLVREVPSRWTSLPAADREALEASCLPGMRVLQRSERS